MRGREQSQMFSPQRMAPKIELLRCIYYEKNLWIVQLTNVTSMSLAHFLQTLPLCWQAFFFSFLSQDVFHFLRILPQFQQIPPPPPVFSSANMKYISYIINPPAPTKIWSSTPIMSCSFSTPCFLLCFGTSLKCFH